METNPPYIFPATMTIRSGTRVKGDPAREPKKPPHPHPGIPKHGDQFPFRIDPHVDLLVIEPSPMESTLFLSGSMNFAERVQSLNFGYNPDRFLDLAGSRSIDPPRV